MKRVLVLFTVAIVVFTCVGCTPQSKSSSTTNTTSGYSTPSAAVDAYFHGIKNENPDEIFGTTMYCDNFIETANASSDDIAAATAASKNEKNTLDNIFNGSGENVDVIGLASFYASNYSIVATITNDDIDWYYNGISQYFPIEEFKEVDTIASYNGVSSSYKFHCARIGENWYILGPFYWDYGQLI